LGKLRVLSGKEVCAILAQHGFAEIRRRGSHIIMQKKLSHSTIYAGLIKYGVPVISDYREIRIGTLQSIIRQSGMPRSEFEL
jgi:predicted RNA binding protein YcfA (HicA-like mRNA interferase family)